MNIFKIFILVFMLLFINKVQSKNLYLKAELPIYKKYMGLDTEENKKYKKSTKNLSDSYGLGIGYNFSDYIETELIFDQMKYLYFGNIDTFKTMSIDPPEPKIKLKKNQYLSFAQKNKDGAGVCSNIPQNFVTLEELYSNPSPSISGKRSFLEQYTKTVIKMKLQTLIASVKFKVPTKKRLVPFITLGAGASKMKIDEKSDKLNPEKNDILSIPTLKNKTSFAYRVGLGMKFKISENSALEVYARYFDYGKYKLSNGDQKRIKGHDFSAGVILGF